MTRLEIDQAIEKILDNKHLKQDLEINKSDAYKYRNTHKLPKKLELLFKAGKLKLKDE